MKTLKGIVIVALFASLTLCGAKEVGNKILIAKILLIKILKARNLIERF